MKVLRKAAGNITVCGVDSYDCENLLASNFCDPQGIPENTRVLSGASLVVKDRVGCACRTAKQFSHCWET